MPKKKKEEKRADAFTTSPFKALKGFGPKAAPPLAKSRKSVPIGEEYDAVLFQQAMSGTRRIGPSAERKNDLPGSGKSPDRAAEAPEETDAGLFLRAMGAIGTAAFYDEASEPEEEPAARSSSSRIRQLKRGTIRISQELDLHGFPKDEALRRLERFIASASARGQQAVLVITGKGINSPDGPVLRGAVASWLREKGRGMVAEFLPAPREKGGSGAFVVFLKKKTN